MERKMSSTYGGNTSIWLYSKGLCEKTFTEEANFPNDRKWYLPHLGFVNLNKDAAAEVNGVSLNSNHLKGPLDIELLVNILFNLRKGRVAVCADIREIVSSNCDKV